MACDKCCRHVRAMPARAPHANGAFAASVRLLCRLAAIARPRRAARPGHALALPPPSGLVLTPLRTAAAADHRVPELPRPHPRRRVYRHRADRATGLAHHRHCGVAALCGGGRAAGVHHVPQVRNPPAAVHLPPALREPSRVRPCAACAAPAPRNAAPAASRCRCRSCCSSACWSAVRPRPPAPPALPACRCPARGRRAPTNAHADARIAALALAILLDWSQVEEILDKEIHRVDNASSVGRPAMSARAARARGAPTTADTRVLLGRPLASW